MKLRIRGNSLRLRLTRTEIARLASDGFVADRVQLGAHPDCVLSYQLVLSNAVNKVIVTFQVAHLDVLLPTAEGRDWARTDKVGIYSEESWGLKLAIEKDFKCLDPRLDEDESDAFENPHGTHHAACTAVED